MGNELTGAERMTRFETQLENLVVVVTRMDTWQVNFVSKELLDEKLRARDEKIERLENEKTSHKNNLPLWIAAAVISLIVSIWPHVK